MALTDTRHDSTVHQAGTSASPTGPDSSLVVLDSLFGSGDHKVTGRLWMVCASVFLLAGTIVSMVAALEHLDLGGFAIVEDEAAFTQLWSLGRDLILFGGIVPLLLGLAVHIVPLQVGSPALAFPRGAAAAFWMWLMGTALVVVGYVAGGGPAGWSDEQVLLWMVALGFAVIGLCWGMICVASTVVGARTAGMDLQMVPASTWGFLVFSLGGLFSLPLLIAQLVVAYLDVNYGHLPDEASRVALVGIVDSISLAPAIYWIGIPALAIAVETIAVHTGRPLRFHRSLLGMLGALGIVSFGAQFFTFSSHGREIAFDNGILVATLIVAVLPILGSLALAAESVKSGSFRLRTPLLAGLLAGLVLLVAAATSLLAVIWPIVRFIETTFDTSVNLDSSLNLAGTSFHEGIMGMVIGAGFLGAIAGAHHWGHKMWGRALDDRLGMASTVAAAAGGLVWGVGQVVAGILGQQRLPIVDPGAPGGVEALNAVSAVGLALLVLAVLALLGNLVRVALGRGSSNEPWRGYSLEWSTASPPPPANFAVPPVVRSTNPLADPDFLTANQATLTSGQATETEPA